MSVLVQFGTLPLGVEMDGERCREFTLRPLQARDSMAVRHGEDGRRIAAVEEENPELAAELMGLALLGRRLAIDGFPAERQDLAFMERIWDDDLAEIMAAEGRLQAELARFRGEAASAANAGAAAGGDSVAGGAGDAGRGGAALDRGLGGDQEPEGEGGGTREDPPPAEAP